MKKISQHPQITPFTQNILADLLNKKDLSKYLSKLKSHDEIKIVYFGTPEFSAYILEKLIEFCETNQFDVRPHTELVRVPKKYIVQAVITNPDKKAGRKQQVIQSQVAVVASKHYIPLLKPPKLDEEFVTNQLSLLNADLFIVVSFGQILPRSLLNIPGIGTLNIHGSILPNYRGASPIQQAILNGDWETGVTLMLMDEELDHGSIISTKKISILEQDNYQTLSKKMMQLSADLLLEILPKFVDGKIKPVRQNHTKATFCQRLTKKSGYFPIENPPDPQILDKMIRAYYPWPGVWTKWNGKIVKFLPGNMLQMEGKKAIPVKDFLNGYPDFPLYGKITSQI